MSKFIPYTKEEKDRASQTDLVDLLERNGEKLKKESKNEELEFEYNKNGRLILKEFPDEKKYNKSNELSILHMSEKSKLPNNIKVLLATSALKEGISINNEDLGTVICYSHNLSDLLQYMGRVRESKYSLYIIQDAKQFPSGISEIAYKYSEKEGVDSANKYISTLNDEEKYKFIEYIEEKIPYIRFNYLNTCFELYTVLYNYHKYLENINAKSKKFTLPLWQKEMLDFFNKYEISINTFEIDNKSSKYSNSYVKTAVKEILEFYGNKWLLSDEWKIPKKKLETIFELPSINKEEPNKDLKERIENTGIHIHIKYMKKRVKSLEGKGKEFTILEIMVY